MKRCPECRRDYYDDTLLYCLDDGNALLEGPAAPFGVPFGVPPSGGSSEDEPATAILSEPPASAGGQFAEAKTRPQIHATAESEPQESLSGLSERQSLSAHRAAKPQEADAEDRAEQPQNKQPQSKRNKLFAIFGIAVLLLVGGFFGYRYFAPIKQIESIAVMPFVNESGNADVEYLSDGMTETLIKSLSNLPNLNVKPRSSVFRYKGKDTDLKTIGSELNVEAILTGRVVQRGDQLTLSLELIDVQNDRVLWTESYQRKQSDLVSLQSEIAKDVSTKLKLELSGADEARVTKNDTTSPEAYQLYLKGRFVWNKRTSESLKQAVEYYRQAIEKDPAYARAYAGLAETYVLFPIYSLAAPNEVMPKAKSMALRALEMDDSLAEAHAVLGCYLSFYEFDRAGAEREFRRAIELSPNYATAYQWLGNDVLNPVKRFDEALVVLRRAEEIDPLSPIIGANLGDSFLYQRQYDEAVTQQRRVLSFHPDFAFGHFSLGSALDAMGRNEEAVSAFRKSLELNYDPTTKAQLAMSLAKAGQRDEAIKLLDQLKQESSVSYVSPMAFALIYIGLNEKDVALTWLEKGVSERSSYATFMAVEPMYDDLRTDPRFAAMLKRMNLPE